MDRAERQARLHAPRPPEEQAGERHEQQQRGAHAVDIASTRATEQVEVQFLQRSNPVEGQFADESACCRIREGRPEVVAAAHVNQKRRAAIGRPVDAAHAVAGIRLLKLAYHDGGGRRVFRLKPDAAKELRIGGRLKILPEHEDRARHADEEHVDSRAEAHPPMHAKQTATQSAVRCHNVGGIGRRRRS
jgi:hypothetical protein